MTSESLLPLAIQALDSPEKGMRLLARQRILEMGDAGLGALKRLAMEEYDNVAVEAAHALCEGDFPHHAEVLEDLCRSKNQLVSRLAMAHLKKGL